MKNLFGLASLAFMAAPLSLFTCPAQAPAQALDRPGADAPIASAAAGYGISTYSSSFPGSGPARLSAEYSADSANAGLPLADPPEPAAFGGGREHAHMAPDAEWRQPPFSRIGIGADVNPLGIGIKGAVVLNHYYDARMMVNFFNYSSGRFEVEGFNVHANLHMASAGASLDWYPLGSIWRISPGLLFFNGNQISGSTDIVPGTVFTVDNQDYYSANPNPATGATPLTATGVVSLHKNQPAFTVAGGFGKFIPRSDRHWSFPSEFGVIFNGAPNININASGWACLDYKQTECSDIGNPNNPIAIKFNNSLQGQLNKWRKDMRNITLYPLFSYSVVYSFNIR